jgi:CelD/BcsL family acetyltransferase involved in cellulose biosynthesis
MSRCAVAVQVIENHQRFCEISDEWRDFLREREDVTPFQTPQWLLTWWAHYGSGRLHVMVFRHESRMVGILPCFLHQWENRRQLTLIGTGISDYLEPVLSQTHCSAILDALRSHLEAYPEWDVCDWQDLSASTPLQVLGPTAEDTPCSELDVAQPFESLLEDRPKYLKRNLRYCNEKGKSLGTLRFVVHAHADPELMRTLIELHAARWQESGQPGTIEANHAAAFLGRAAEELAEANMLRLFTMTLNQRVVAIVMALRSATTVFSYLTAFDPEFRKYGFGHELLRQAMRHAHRTGYRRWNFLRGEEPYKQAWGAERIPKRRLRLERSKSLAL